MEIVIQKQAEPKPETLPQAPAGAEPQVVIPTPEELRERAIATYTAMGWGAPPEEKKPAAATPPAEPASQPAAGAPGSAPPAAAHAPAAGTPPPAAGAQPAAPAAEEPHEPTTTEIIARAAKETAREVAHALRPEPAAPAPTAPGFEMTEDDKSDLKVLQYLERENPAKYKGMPQRFIDYVKAHYAFIEDWQSKNPDKELDEQDPDYRAWLTANQPDVDMSELERARIDMQVEEKIEQKLAPQREQERRDKALAEAIPAIGQRINTSIVKMAEAVDPELAKHVKDANGNPNLTEEAVAKIEEADPIAKEVMDEQVTNRLEPMIRELELTQVNGLGYVLNPKGNEVHRELSRFVSDKERELLKGPAEVREVNGRQFCTLADYSKRMNAIMKLPTDERRQEELERLDQEVWCLTADMIEDLLVDSCAKEARAIIQKRNAQAEKKYGKGRAPGTTPTPAPAAAVPPGPMPAGYKPRPPAGGGQSELVTTGLPGRQAEKTYGESAVDVNFSR